MSAASKIWQTVSLVGGDWDFISTLLLLLQSPDTDLMQKHLYFICPTDHLERVIDSTFKQDNYFYTSLGNSITFDAETLEQLVELLSNKNIQNISFVLSDDNSIVLDALGNHEFSQIDGLSSFYREIARQKDRSILLWKSHHLQFSILSNFLNQKIKELRLALGNIYADRIKINGIIYLSQQKTFSDIYSDWICEENFRFSLN